MKKHAITAGVLATLAIGLAAPALASTDSVVTLPPGAPMPVYSQEQSIGSTSWFAPFGASVQAAYGVSAQ